MSLKVVTPLLPENESPKITTYPAKTFKSSRTVRLPVQFPNRCASPSVSPPCAKRLGRSVGGGGVGGSVALAGGVWGEPSLRLSTLDTTGDWALGGQDPRPGRESLTLSRVHPESSADNPAPPRREPKAVDGRDAAPCLDRSQAHRNAHPEGSASRTPNPSFGAKAEIASPLPRRQGHL